MAVVSLGQDTARDQDIDLEGPSSVKTIHLEGPVTVYVVPQTPEVVQLEVEGSDEGPGGSSTIDVEHRDPPLETAL